MKSGGHSADTLRRILGFHGDRLKQVQATCEAGVHLLQRHSDGFGSGEWTSIKNKELTDFKNDWQTSTKYRLLWFKRVQTLAGTALHALDDTLAVLEVFSHHVWIVERDDRQLMEQFVLVEDSLCNVVRQGSLSEKPAGNSTSTVR